MAVVFSGTTKKEHPTTRDGRHTLGGNPSEPTNYEQGKVGCLFPMLPPFAADAAAVGNALKVSGKKGKGDIIDAADETDIGANPNLEWPADPEGMRPVQAKVVVSSSFGRAGL